MDWTDCGLVHHMPTQSFESSYRNCPKKNATELQDLIAQKERKKPKYWIYRPSSDWIMFRFNLVNLCWFLSRFETRPFQHVPLLPSTKKKLCDHGTAAGSFKSALSQQMRTNVVEGEEFENQATSRNTYQTCARGNGNGGRTVVPYKSLIETLFNTVNLRIVNAIFPKHLDSHILAQEVRGLQLKVQFPSKCCEPIVQGSLRA